jgi:hypothetical protein
MKDDIVCAQCSGRYTTLTRPTQVGNVIGAESTINVSASKQHVESGGQITETLPTPAGLSDKSSDLKGQIPRTQLPADQRLHTNRLGYGLLGIGLVALAASVMFGSTILVFIGLGLAFWGMLVFFVRPQKYIRSDLMTATAWSSLKTVDDMMLGLGYRERGVYIPAGPEKAVVFIPSEPFSRLPSPSVIAQGLSADGKLYLHDPDGLLVVPPGLALANLIEKKLGFNVKDSGLDRVIQSLPKVLVNLEIVSSAEIEVESDFVRFKLADSIYADFCKQVRDNSRPCGLGCPMCSALACILAVATGKPVLFEEDKLAPDGKTTLSNYQLLAEPRL